MPSVETIFHSLFAVDSIWSVIIRGAVWFAIALVVIVSTDSPNPAKSMLQLKSNLGFFLFFLLLSGGLLFMLFGYTSQV